MEVKQFGGGVPPVIADAWPMPDHVITAEAMMWKWPEMNFYAGELRVKMRYYSETTWAVGIAQLTHHEVQGGGKNPEIIRSYIMILVKYIEIWTFHVLLLKYYDSLSVWFGGNLTGSKRRGVSKCRPMLWLSSGRRIPACIHGFLLSSPISIVESTCLLRP